MKKLTKEQKEIYASIIDKDEKLICLLVSKYPVSDVGDIIDEACGHQLEASYGAGRKEALQEVGEWLNKKHHSDGRRLVVYLQPYEIEALKERGEMPKGASDKKP